MKSKKGGELICMRPENIIEARFKLNNRQNDIMDMVFASITDDDKLEYEIDVLKYSNLYKLKNKSTIYGELKKAVMTFEGKGFKVKTKDGKREDWFSWFSRITYIDGEGRIIVELGSSLKKIFLSVKRAIYYNISYTLNFNSSYSRRLYYYLKLYEDTGKRIDNIDILREKLECPKGYKNFADFNRYVLKPAYSEINGNSDISFEYESIKTGRKMTHIKFQIKKAKNKIDKTNISISTVDDEISATVTEGEEIATVPNIKECENIMKNIIGIEISNKSANEIYRCAIKHKKHGNEPLKLIKEVAEYSKTQNIKGNFVGWFKNIVTKYEKPFQLLKKENFNDYDGQRPFDPSIEKKLLGWCDEEKIETTGEEFQQLAVKQ